MSEAFTMESVNQSKWFDCSLSHQQKILFLQWFVSKDQMSHVPLRYFNEVSVICHLKPRNWLSFHCLLLPCLLTLCWIYTLFTPVFFAIHFEDSIPGNKARDYTSNLKRNSGHDYNLFILLKTTVNFKKLQISHLKQFGNYFTFKAVIQCKKWHLNFFSWGVNY